MHMTRNNRHFVSANVLLIASLAIIEVLIGGFFKLPGGVSSPHYAAILILMIATARYYASDGPSGLKLERACSFNKL